MDNELRDKILSTPMRENDAEADTIGDYITSLALGAWIGEESFSGKRPFGNSGWKHEIYGALAEHGFIPGEVDIDEDGHVDIIGCDTRKGEDLITDVILGVLER